MKKLLLGSILLAWLFVFPVQAMAGVDVRIAIPLPPPIVFAAPPHVVVLPETNVYVVPDVDADIFFHNGWWWRRWEGRWYRSRSYGSGWGYYKSIPSFYRGVPPGWRNDYREHRWRGHQWDHQRIPHEQLQRNWSTWEKNRHWEKQNAWGVQGLKPQMRSQQPPHAVQPHPQAKPPVRETARPQQPHPQSGEVQRQHAQPQQREAPQQSKSQHGKPERGEQEKHDRR
jgi:hypothetical protein